MPRTEAAATKLAAKPTTRASANRRDRAWRFSLPLPLRYRVTRESEWRCGEIENVSSSGVFFHSQNIMEPGTVLEMCWKMPISNGGRAVEVVCWGIVVRQAYDVTTSGLIPCAAKIVHFRWGCK